MYIPGPTPIAKQFGKLQQTNSSKAARKICELFFDAFNSEQAIEKLKMLLTVYLQADDEEIGGQERGNMMYFCDNLEMLIKAVAKTSEPGLRRLKDDVEFDAGGLESRNE